MHGHWTLARLLRLHPGIPEAAAIIRALDANLNPASIAGEVAYLQRPHTGAFERTYGWAWLLKLSDELRAGGTAHARRWAAALEPLAEAFVARYLGFLPRAMYPIRSGTHANSAFGLAFAHDYAVRSGGTPLRHAVEAKARAYFLHDRECPAHLEPGGADFLSPALMEAALMCRVLPPAEFAGWLRRLLPGAAAGEPRSLFTPAEVTDRADPQIVHLDGLNLSRAWCLRTIAAAVPPADPVVPALLDSASRHLDAALPHVRSGHYSGEHWLATFALLAITGD